MCGGYWSWASAPPSSQTNPHPETLQKIGVDVMDLPCTERGNRHIVVFQDIFTKWPMVFAVPDQRTERIARLLCEEIIPTFGVPEALLSDRGTNLLSHLMLDICRLLGIEKLNTTSYHPECDEMVERFNRTLECMLRKRAAQFNKQRTITFRPSSGPTAIHHTTRLARSRPFSFSVGIVGLHKKQLCCQ